MADIDGFAADPFADQIGVGFFPDGTSASLPFALLPPDDLLAEIPSAVIEGGAVVEGSIDPIVPGEVDGNRVPNMGDTWFEKLWLTPTSVAFGDIVTEQVVTVELYNSHLFTPDIIFSSITNALTGIVFSGLSLPETIVERESLVFTMTATVEGELTFDEGIDFVTDERTATINVSGQRVSAFPFRPERPISEFLEFKTDIIQSVSGVEQRICLREFPRKAFRYDYFREQGNESRIMANYLTGIQGNRISVPIWPEAMNITSAVTIGDTVINVSSTDDRDIQVGSPIMLVTDDTTFNTSTVASFTTTTVTLSTPTSLAFTTGYKLFPAKICVIVPGSVSGQRARFGADFYSVEFLADDQDNDLADASAYGTLNSKTLLTNVANLANGDTFARNFPQRVTLIDGQTGQFTVQPLEDKSFETGMMGFKSNTLASLQEKRGLFYALFGRQMSFYHLTNQNEMIVALAISASDTAITIEFQGYAAFVESISPNNRLRLTESDGTTHDFVVNSAVDNDDGTETLTIDTAFPSVIALDDIESVNYVKLSRFDTDRIEIKHLDGTGQSEIFIPMTDVKDEI